MLRSIECLDIADLPCYNLCKLFDKTPGHPQWGCPGGSESGGILQAQEPQEVLAADAEGSADPDIRKLAGVEHRVDGALADTGQGGGLLDGDDGGQLSGDGGRSCGRSGHDGCPPLCSSGYFSVSCVASGAFCHDVIAEELVDKLTLLGLLESLFRKTCLSADFLRGDRCSVPLLQPGRELGCVGFGILVHPAYGSGQPAFLRNFGALLKDCAGEEAGKVFQWARRRQEEPDRNGGRLPMPPQSAAVDELGQIIGQDDVLQGHHRRKLFRPQGRILFRALVPVFQDTFGIQRDRAAEIGLRVIAGKPAAEDALCRLVEVRAVQAAEIRQLGLGVSTSVDVGDQSVLKIGQFCPQFGGLTLISDQQNFLVPADQLR